LPFELQQSWREEARTAPAISLPAVEALLAGRELRLGKGVGTILTVAVHLLLLWLFATRLDGTAPEGGGKPSPRIEMISLTLASPEPEPPAASAASPPPPAAAAAASQVDLSARTELPAPEWTVSRIVSALPARNGEVAQASSAKPGKGGGVYDPFAGAAPMRGNDALVWDASIKGFVQSGAESSLRLDEANFAQFRTAFARAHPTLRGTIELDLNVSAEGIVLSAAPPAGSLAQTAEASVGAALLGRRLFLGTTGGATQMRIRWTMGA